MEMLGAWYGRLVQTSRAWWASGPGVSTLDPGAPVQRWMVDFADVAIAAPQNWP